MAKKHCYALFLLTLHYEPHFSTPSVVCVMMSYVLQRNMPLLMILGDLEGHLRCFNFYSAGKLDIDAVMSCTRKQMNVATHHSSKYPW